MAESRNREMLPGLSVRQWEFFDTRICIGGVVLLVLAVPFGIAAGQEVGWAVPVAVSLGVVGALGVGWYIVPVSPSVWKEKRELAAGYTTRPFPHNPDVDLVESTTGVVIREAGAQALTKEGFDEAVRLVHHRHLRR